jgi:pullulanase/glycogen debranching enzyme
VEAPEPFQVVALAPEHNRSFFFCWHVVTAPLDPGREPAVPRGLDDAIVYELHVGGFTRHGSSGVRHPGT